MLLRLLWQLFLVFLYKGADALRLKFLHSISAARGQCNVCTSRFGQRLCCFCYRTGTYNQEAGARLYLATLKGVPCGNVGYSAGGCLGESKRLRQQGDGIGWHRYILRVTTIAIKTKTFTSAAPDGFTL